MGQSSELPSAQYISIAREVSDAIFVNIFIFLCLWAYGSVVAWLVIYAKFPGSKLLAIFLVVLIFSLEIWALKKFLKGGK